MSTKSNKYLFTIREAYRLGDAFHKDGKLIAAEVCYAFAEMKPLPMPILNDAAVDPNKLSNLIAYRKRINYPVPKKCRGKGKDIPQDCLKLIQAFYDPWLQQIKPDMKERSDEHAQRRMKGVIEVFKAVTNDKLGRLVLDDIAKANHNQQIDKIDAWNGPSFGKFQIRDNQKMKNNFSLSRLTVVLDFKNYRKRCRNSQEDWFKAIDGRFFAQCLNKAYKIFVDKFPDDRERQYVGILFIKALLDKYIQFPSASAKLLVPAGTIFANPELMETIHRFHPHVNPTQIKQKARSRAVRVLHKRLMEDVNTEYDRICSSMQNPLLTFTSKEQPQSPPSTTSPPEVANVNVNAATDNNNNTAAPQRSMPRFSPQNSSSFGSEADEIVNNDDGFLQMMVNNGDIEMHAINTTNPGAENTEDINVLGMESRPGLERNYSFNGSQSDGSSFIHNEHGSTSGQSDNEHDEDENADIENGWITSPAEPLCPVVQFPLLSNRNNTTIITNPSTQTPNSRITNPFAPSTPVIMEQQQQPQTQQISYQPQQPQQVQQVQFQFQMTQQQPQTDAQLPELPDNLNIAAWLNVPEEDQKMQENEEKVNVNNCNEEVMPTVNIPDAGTGLAWDGMTQIGTDVVNVNSNQSMMPFINDVDNRTTFQPLPSTQPMRMTMDTPQIQTQPQVPSSCPPQCNCHLNNHQNNQNNDYCHDQNDQQYYNNQTNQPYYDQNNENYPMNQESLPPVPTPMPQAQQQQHNHGNCDCSFCNGFGGNDPNVNNMVNSYTSTPSLHTPSVGTRSVVSGDARSVGSGSASGVSALVMNSNNPYKTIQIQAPSQYMQQQYPSRQSSPAYTPNTMSNPFGSQINHQLAMPQTMMKEASVNAFDDTFEIENPMSVTQDMCMGCYETQCKCDVIAMNKRYKPNFQNTSTFNTRNNRIHHQNMQSISNYTANNRKQRRQLHIEQLNNIRMREINNNQNYNNYNNNWSNSMNVRTF